MEKSHNDPFVFRTATSLLFLSFLFFFFFQNSYWPYRDRWGHYIWLETHRKSELFFSIACIVSLCQTCHVIQILVLVLTCTFIAFFSTIVRDFFRVFFLLLYSVSFTSWSVINVNSLKIFLTSETRTGAKTYCGICSVTTWDMNTVVPSWSADSPPRRFSKLYI